MIDLETARQIAYAWHGGGGSPLYSFASTSNDGQPRNVTHDAVQEVSDDLEVAEAIAVIGSDNDSDIAELQSLRDFLVAHLPAEEEDPN